jgi:ABC-type sugar transport system ATPase subunit
MGNSHAATDRRAKMRAAFRALNRVALDESQLDHRYRAQYRAWLAEYREKLRACMVPGVRDPGVLNPRW